MNLSTFISALTERVQRPGLLGVAGHAIEKRCAREVKAYFEDLFKDIRKLKLEDLAHADTKPAKEFIYHNVEMRLSNVLRRHGTILKLVLRSNLEAAYRLGIKLDYAQEAKAAASKRDIQQKGLDILGPSGEKAAKWASDGAARLVTDIDATTRQQIADAIMKGIEDRAGVPGTGRLIRELLDNASRYRSEMIASTEMNRAMSTAALEKMQRLGIEYKQIILSEDACEICEGAADQDPLPVDEDYDTDDGPQAGPPFHPNCRCAVTGARPPEDEES